MQVLILVKSTVPVSQIDAEDRKVPGTYRAELDSSIDAGRIANAALDGFHEAVPVGVLDYFEFSVHEFESGRILHEDLEGETYAHGKACRSVAKVSDDLDPLCVRALAASSPASLSM